MSVDMLPGLQANMPQACLMHQTLSTSQSSLPQLNSHNLFTCCRLQFFAHCFTGACCTVSHVFTVCFRLHPFISVYLILLTISWFSKSTPNCQSRPAFKSLSIKSISTKSDVKDGLYNLHHNSQQSLSKESSCIHNFKVSKANFISYSSIYNHLTLTLGSGALHQINHIVNVDVTSPCVQHQYTIFSIHNLYAT